LLGAADAGAQTTAAATAADKANGTNLMATSKDIHIAAIKPQRGLWICRFIQIFTPRTIPLKLPLLTELPFTNKQ
jgi:hypothetical protein